MERRPLNISNEVIRAISGAHSYNEQTKTDEPHYTRPNGQSLEQLVYTDDKWVKRANIQYNQPNNIKNIYIGLEGIIVNYYKPIKFITNDGKIIQKKQHIERYQGNIRQQTAINHIKWLTTPRIHQNIEEIVYDIRLFNSIQQIEDIKIFLKQEVYQGGENFQRLKGVYAVSLAGYDISNIHKAPQMVEELKKLGVQVKQIYKTQNLSNKFIVRVEYYKYDQEVLKQLANVINTSIQDKQKQNEYYDALRLKGIIDNCVQEFGEKDTQKMLQLQIKEAVNLNKSQIYTLDVIKKKISDELVESGNSGYVKYIEE